MAVALELARRRDDVVRAEDALELGLEVGQEAVCVVKATNVIVEIPSSKESRS